MGDGGGETAPGEADDGLFVYGELCRAEVLLELIDRIPAAVPALLLEHRRRRNPDTGYYEAYGSADGYVAGLLLEGLTDGELERLDAFEGVDGGAYRRVEARVRIMARGHPERQAWVYLGSGPDRAAP